MKASIEIQNPGDVQASITLTMSVKRWVELKDTLKDAPYHGPAQDIRDAVWQLTEAVNRKINYTPAGADVEDGE